MKKNRQFFLIGVVLIVVTVSTVFLLSRRQNQNQFKVPADLRAVQAQFTNKKDTSPDAPQLNRLVRGSVTQVSGLELTLATLVNWPDKTAKKDIIFTLTDRTEYLCWPTTMNGAKIEDSVFLLTEQTKLQLQGEKYLTKDQAVELLNKQHSSAILALQKMYVEAPGHPEANQVFQVAVIGCQQ